MKLTEIKLSYYSSTIQLTTELLRTNPIVCWGMCHDVVDSDILQVNVYHES